jgi:ABC-type transporter Mla subunit MlaD
MEQGKLDTLPEGLKDEIKDNPDEVAKATGKTNDEVRQIADSADALRDLLNQNPEVLKKLAASEQAMQRVLEKQNAVEKRLAEALKKTDEASESARKNVNEAIDVAHVLKAMSP